MFYVNNMNFQPEKSITDQSTLVEHNFYLSDLPKFLNTASSTDIML